MAAKHIGHEIGEGRRVAHVQRRGSRTAARRGDADGLGLRIVSVAVGQDDERAPVARALGRARRRSRGPAGDESHSPSKRAEAHRRSQGQCCLASSVLNACSRSATYAL